MNTKNVSRNKIADDWDSRVGDGKIGFSLRGFTNLDAYGREQVDRDRLRLCGLINALY